MPRTIPPSFSEPQFPPRPRLGVASALLAAVLFAVTGCRSSTEPDASGKLGYARFAGVFRSAVGHTFPIPVVGAAVAVTCGLFDIRIPSEYFGAQAITGSNGSFVVDVDVPGTLRYPSPIRQYTCWVQATDPGPTSTPACTQVTATFGASPSNRPVFTSDLMAGRYSCVFEFLK